MSAKHLDNIRDLLCVVCGEPWVEPHHLKHGMVAIGERGVSRRAADRYAIPLCRADHDYYGEGNDEERLASVGIDGRALAAELWANRDNFEAMLRTAFRFHQASKLYRVRHKETA